MAAEPLRADVPRDYLAIVDKLTRRAAPAMRRAILAGFAGARADFARLLESLPPLEAAAVEQLWTDLLKSLIKLYGDDGPLFSGMMQAGEDVAGLLEADWSLIERGFRDRASLWLESHGAAKVTAVTGETRSAIRQVAADALSAPVNRREAAKRILEIPGLGLDRQQQRHFEALIEDIIARGDDRSAAQIQQEINRAYQRKLRYRAKRIAWTETEDAGNAAIDQALREAVEVGQVDESEIEVEWVARAVVACPDCRAFDGARRGIRDALFESKPVESGRNAGRVLTAARPTLHPLCACALRTVRKAERLAA